MWWFSYFSRADPVPSGQLCSGAAGESQECSGCKSTKEKVDLMEVKMDRMQHEIDTRLPAVGAVHAAKAPTPSAKKNSNRRKNNKNKRKKKGADATSNSMIATAAGWLMDGTFAKMSIALVLFVLFVTSLTTSLNLAEVLAMKGGIPSLIKHQGRRAFKSKKVSAASPPRPPENHASNDKYGRSVYPEEFKNEDNSMSPPIKLHSTQEGLILPDGEKIRHRNAQENIEWPTISPVNAQEKTDTMHTMTMPPTFIDYFYPDFTNGGICNNDPANLPNQLYSQLDFNLFQTMEECCHFWWQDDAVDCMEKSTQLLNKDDNSPAPSPSNTSVASPDDSSVPGGDKTPSLKTPTPSTTEPVPMKDQDVSPSTDRPNDSQASKSDSTTTYSPTTTKTATYAPTNPSATVPSLPPTISIHSTTTTKLPTTSFPTAPQQPGWPTYAPTTTTFSPTMTQNPTTTLYASFNWFYYDVTNGICNNDPALGPGWYDADDIGDGLFYTLKECCDRLFRDSDGCMAESFPFVFEWDFDFNYCNVRECHHPTPHWCTKPNNEECGCEILEQKDYRGNVSETVDGTACVRWDDTWFENNPDSGVGEKNSSGNIVGNDFNYCNVRECHHPTPHWCTKPNNEECGCDILRQTDYRGNISETGDGTACVRWDDLSVESYPNAGLEEMDSSGNIVGNKYCRSPDDDGRAWCWTSDDYSVWDECNVPMCDLRTCMPECENSNDSNYGCPSFLQAEECCEEDDSSCKCPLLKEACSKSLENSTEDFCDEAILACHEGSYDPNHICSTHEQICIEFPSEYTCKTAAEKCCPWD
eukprot:CAMPEP_0183787596 /NCGR_PEP_ID=MMETSP0739-20130205/67625_1 /TAXON_ID=385413 /ORGANISM="Thalassiosira miniscula, Strain CCMP1093" /LENGTH=810 /DNA_ID=CAMNT_0026031685 /DNA_START=78 /DNA_END=2507 /DNA_ORIENTATION=-